MYLCYSKKVHLINEVSFVIFFLRFGTNSPLGEPLESNMALTWSVSVWDQNQNQSPWQSKFNCFYKIIPKLSAKKVIERGTNLRREAAVKRMRRRREGEGARDERDEGMGERKRRIWKSTKNSGKLFWNCSCSCGR